jgi:hypothetical protein
MSTIYGLLGIQDRDTTVDFVGQNAVYDAVNQLVAMYEAEVNKATGVFVGSEDWTYLEKVKLPGGGMMQESDRLSPTGTVKRTGGYDVAYPIYDARDGIGWDDVSYAYMRLVELDAHLQGVINRMLNWKRYRILRALMNNSNETVNDERWGSITVRRLANTDGSLYPPALGSSSESDYNHYLVSGYASSSISNNNNPFPTVKNTLEQHFGEGRVVAFVNNAESPYIQALSAFVPVTPMGTIPGSNTAIIQGQTDTAESRMSASIPGKLIGEINDVLIYEYRWIPAGYIVAVDLDQEAPLRRRFDQPESLRGFRLVAQNLDFPLISSTWRLREGYGVRNRLNGVVMQLTTNGSYTIPTLYS